MSKIIRFSLGLVVVVLSVYACNSINPTTDQKSAVMSGTSALSLTKAVTNAGTFNTVGQVINYSYEVKNTGSAVLTGPVVVTDNKTTVSCPDISTIGNHDANLDPLESLICASLYTITQADLNAGSVINNASASIGGITSNTATATVIISASKTLTIATTANPTTFSQAGQIITFTYIVKNTGSAALGPAQFVVRDERLPNPINCDVATKTLASNETVTCSGTYPVTQNDLNTGSIVSRATASGGGATTIEPATITVNSAGTGGSSSSSGLTRGSTVSHTVLAGEWLLQIARCYGADFNTVWKANPGVVDPDVIEPKQVLSIPNIGSNGTIYGPPCVVSYTAVSGDTWDSIARKYNADVAVLMYANKKVTLGNGVILKIPINSAGGTQIPPSNDATRITFPAGASSVTIPGSVSAQGTIRYRLNATAGQTLNVKVNGPANELALGITSPTGAILKQRDATLTWNNPLTASGDHIIEVAGVSGANGKSFTMEVSLTTTVVSLVERVTDLYAGAGDSSPSYLALFNGVLYFRADGNDNAGGELWKYDNTLKASRVADINLNATGSEPAFLKDYNGALYFRANGNDGAGIELWRYNGSAVGRFNDMNTAAGDFNPSHLAVYKGYLYFSANGNDGAGTELWRTDGITINRVADIYGGTGDSNPAYLTEFNGLLYFSALSNDGAGIELYKYDGTNPPARVWDINPGVGNSNPAHLAVFNNALYFSANGNDGTGTELWKYDGTNVTRAADINVGPGDSAPAYLTQFKNELYFSANGNDGTGFELWKFNGTNASRVADINKSGDSNPSYLIVYNTELYFQANGGDGAGRELWKFKGP